MEGLKEGGAFRTYATINVMTTMGCQVVPPAVQAQPISGTCRYMFVQEVTPLLTQFARDIDDE